MWLEHFCCVSIRTKIASLVLGKKGLDDLLPITYRVDGKTYFKLSDSNEALERFLKVLSCDYSDSNLVTLFYSIAEIFAPIDAIAKRVALAKFEVRDLITNALVTTNKELNQLLSQPNPLQNWSQFIYESTCWEYLNGRNFIYGNIPDTLSFDYKNISTLTNLWSYMVTPLHDPSIKFLSATKIDDIIKGYRLAGYPDIPTEKVLFNQFMSLDAADRKILFSKSPLHSAQKAIANLIAVYEARGSIYLNRGALGVLVSKATDAGGAVPITPEQKENVRKDYNNDYGITKGKSPLAITDMPMEWVRIGMSIAELLPFEETQASAAAIYGALNVPQDLMPTPKGATYENQRMAERALYQNIATPFAQSRAAALTNFLRLNEVGLYISASHDHIEVLQDNRKEKAETDKVQTETLLIQFRCGAITMNEWIGKIGGQPVANALYDKRTLEMSKDELDLIMPLLNSKVTFTAPQTSVN